MSTADSTGGVRPENPSPRPGSLHITDQAQCLGCGYLLRDLPEYRCPECGRPFLPNDPGTYFIATEQIGFVRRIRTVVRRELITPIGWQYLAVISSLSFSIVLLATTVSGVRVLDEMNVACCCALYPSLPLMLIAVLCYEAIRGIGRAMIREGPLAELEVRQIAIGSRRRIAVLAIVVLAIGTDLYPWPLALRVAACASELEAAVIADINGGTALYCRNVGSFSVRRVRLGDAPGARAIVIDEWTQGLRDQYRYAALGYDPNRAAPNVRRWLFGPWYVE